VADTIGLPTSDWISHWQELVDMSGVDFTVFTCPNSRTREMTCRGLLVGSRVFCEEPVVICVDRASESWGRLMGRSSTMQLDCGYGSRQTVRR
jgi:predicted dehydrogenase